MAIQILNRKKQESRIDFSRFLSGIPANDYIFQHTPYEEQIRQAAGLLKSADAVLIGAGAGPFHCGGLWLRRQPFLRRISESLSTNTALHI